jgi:hypothetical protein
MIRGRWTSGVLSIHLAVAHDIFLQEKKFLRNAHDMGNETPHSNRHRRLYSDRPDHRRLARGAVQPIGRSLIVSFPRTGRALQRSSEGVSSVSHARRGCSHTHATIAGEIIFPGPDAFSSMSPSPHLDSPAVGSSPPL